MEEYPLTQYEFYTLFKPSARRMGAPNGRIGPTLPTIRAEYKATLPSTHNHTNLIILQNRHFRVNPQAFCVAQATPT